METSQVVKNSAFGLILDYVDFPYGLFCKIHAFCLRTRPGFFTTLLLQIG